MGKLIVLDSSDEGAPTPFLRGILTRSLRNVGIDFKAAYALSSSIKEELEGRESLTTAELRAETARRLDNIYPVELVERYRNPAPIRRTTLISHKDSDQVSPFSLHQHTRCMHASGLSPLAATTITTELFQYLHDKEVVEMDSDALGRLPCRIIHNHCGDEAVQRYLTWTHFSRSDEPIHILIGGATGTGKSTIATEVAHRFGIVRTQSTDMLREVMRVMIPHALLPMLHSSSFEAWRSQPRTNEQADTPSNDEIISGYLTQSKEVSVSSDAIIQRARRENVSLVLEGIHNHPTRMREIAENCDGLVVPLMLAIIKRKDLHKRISGRGEESTLRRAKRYLKNFDAILALQNFLLDDADQQNIPIIHNEDQEETIEQVMLAINDVLAPHFATTESELFPK